MCDLYSYSRTLLMQGQVDEEKREAETHDCSPSAKLCPVCSEPVKGSGFKLYGCVFHRRCRKGAERMRPQFQRLKALERNRRGRFA